MAESRLWGDCSYGPSILRIGCALTCPGDFLCRRRSLEDCLIVFLSTGAWLDCAIDEWGVGFHSGNNDLAAMAGFRFVGRGNIGWCQLIINWHGLCGTGDHLETHSACREKQNRSCQRQTWRKVRGIGSLTCSMCIIRTDRSTSFDQSINCVN